MTGIYLIFGFFTMISYFVGSKLKSKFKEFSRIPTANKMNGRDVVEAIMHEHGITGVKIGSITGQLTDHYNPTTKTINLSKDVYHGQHIAAVAVAAHEAGHAIQHDRAYSLLGLRSKLVPLVSFSSKYMQWVLLAGIMMVETFPSLLLLGIIMFSITTLFSIITLPVEVDASLRALKWLKFSGVTTEYTQTKAEEALKWAAYTYLIGALSSLATLLYYVSIFMRRR